MGAIDNLEVKLSKVKAYTRHEDGKTVRVRSYVNKILRRGGGKQAAGPGNAQRGQYVDPIASRVYGRQVGSMEEGRQKEIESARNFLDEEDYPRFDELIKRGYGGEEALARIMAELREKISSPRGPSSEMGPYGSAPPTRAERFGPPDASQISNLVVRPRKKR